MNTSSIIPALSPADVNMHIGPIFDAERYLELERQLFKVEPRPIPSSGKSRAQPPANKTIPDGFIDAATTFSCWLDDVLKAPFRALSRNNMSASMSKAENADAQKPKASPGQEIAPPPRVYQMRNTQSMRYQRHQMSTKNARREAPQVTQKQNTLPEKLPEIKDGHVKNLIKRYEEWSDITGEYSLEQPTKKNLASEPPKKEKGHSGMTVSFLDGTQGRVVEANYSTPQKKATQKGVTNPAKVASASSIMAKKNAKRRGSKDGGRVTSREEEDVLHVGDTNNRRSGGNRARHKVENGERGRRTVWKKFCGMH